MAEGGHPSHAAVPEFLLNGKMDYIYVKYKRRIVGLLISTNTNNIAWLWQNTHGNRPWDSVMNILESVRYGYRMITICYWESCNKRTITITWLGYWMRSNTNIYWLYINMNSIRGRKFINWFSNLPIIQRSSDLKQIYSKAKMPDIPKNHYVVTSPSQDLWILLLC